MQQVTFAVEFTGERAQPTHRRLMGETPASRADLLVWGPLGSPTSLSWFDAGAGAVERLLDGVESVRETRLVPGDGGTYAFAERRDYEFDPALRALVADAGVAFVPPVTFRESGRMQFEAVGDGTALGELRAAVPDDLRPSVEAVRPFRRRSSTAPLTDRQREAVEAAVAAGYYEVPRTGSVADVAAALDCAHSTAGELLRRAESRLVAGFVDGDPPAHSSG
ncbi:helix-turn-helix domain-containing protein [Halomicrobium urmianum]|uniref:helix-turn-helix domain-containing protein n=1 Tax=Halomicrobium urmianum TaxID=1586233 RepID=UPI0027E43997|nr:helix-turn-helix domain-containing protein [Halomicrobium urmianum]